jgi:hypothetical protein
MDYQYYYNLKANIFQPKTYPISINSHKFILN